MDKDQVAAALTGSGRSGTQARDDLVARGAEIVTAVVELLCAEPERVPRRVCSDVLERIGTPAIGPLLEAVAGGDATGGDAAACWGAVALSRLRLSDPADGLPLLDHPHPTVRGSGLILLRRQGEAVVRRFLGPVVAALGDPVPEIRRQATEALRGIGDEALPVLAGLRGNPAPAPRVRAGALEALAEIGGPAALGQRDREALRRLVRVKLLDEVPRPPHLCGTWYAVPTHDQAAVLDAFGLTAAEPVTLRGGACAWNHDSHAMSSGPHAGCSRVFVSPALDGWTLVFGDTAEDAHRLRNDPEGEAGPVARARCAALSARFGSAHWYGMSCGDGWTAWCVAERGEVVRHYDVYEAAEGGDDGVGAPHPAEAGLLLPHTEPDDDADDADVLAHYEAQCDATDVAARLSVDPDALGPHTVVSGTGVLALTACGLEHGHPAGALGL
ncbi:HEAT repeat domain-containing protein [Streptomyces abyssomicinicus]|uniref:HEAT repeat domain-containing protein n=1 Tax=Streptomyces abyssomicinicus TaxID=574929 RepID=UPI0013E0853D|nr:HEAT repeat domain-containing protein [Streptomyces abyssomicinicus]